MSTTLYWSIRRELWENRSIYIAPLVVAGVYLFGFLIGLLVWAHRMRDFKALDPAKQQSAIILPYSMAATMVLVTGFIVAIFYCADALHGERRDRSILFWKSLPVSDRTTVLSKVAVPMVVLPLVSFTIALATQLIMLPLHAVALMASGVNPAILFTKLPLFQMTLTMFYGLAVHALWFAPIYGWLLLVSAWAKRAVFLWAFLPIFVPYAIETVGFRTQRVVLFLKYRVVGAMGEAFHLEPGKHQVTKLSQLDPWGFLTSPGLWAGLLFAAACIALAVRLRRLREPI